MHLSSSRPSARGSTLIEAMAALVVFSVGILGVMQMNILASQQNNLARSQTAAGRIARDVADSFERIRFDHPLLNVPCLLPITDPRFSDINETEGLVTLDSAVAVNPALRPLMGAADSIVTSEGQGNFYRVAWRSTLVRDGLNKPEQLRILVMVSFPTPGGGVRQVNTWAIKARPETITGDDSTIEEL